MPLGWRLALSTALVVLVVMGLVSLNQQRIQQQHVQQVQNELLRASLVPLASQLETASSPAVTKEKMKAFHAAYLDRGYPEHALALFDDGGKLIHSTASWRTLDEERLLKAKIDLQPLWLAGGPATLMVAKSNETYREAVAQGWLLWFAHFGVTAVIVLLFLTLITHYQVTRPLESLVHGVKKMEMGYWGGITIHSGAWEIRWLSWRFSNMAQEVHHSLTHLLEAEKKAHRSLGNVSGQTRPQQTPHPDGTAVTALEPTDSPEYLALESVLRRLESASTEDEQARNLAKSVWRKETVTANRLGLHRLKARLEDAALRLLEPEAFQELDQMLIREKAAWDERMIQYREDLQRGLDRAGIPVQGILYRFKHTAGVMSKMRSKGLEFNEIQDLFAFRIVVPTEADCYPALGVTHRVFKPEISRFKDYIVRPKANGYRSLHTCVRSDEGQIIEVQIRSVAMDRQAERGDSAHWRYKQEARESAPARDRRWWHSLLPWSVAPP